MTEILKRIILCNARDINKMILVMKITVLFLFISCLHLSARSLSQTVNLQIKNKSLTEVLSVIKKQTGFLVIYNNRHIKDAGTVSIKAKNMSLDNFLNEILKNTGLTYIINEKSILIKKAAEDKKTLNADKPAEIFKQQIAITGKVTDERGEPLAGVSIKIKNVQTSTITDANGNYKISVPNPDAVLIFTYIGFATRESRVGENKVINIKLIQESSKLDEIVVVGYGAVERKDLTGSVSQVDIEDLKQAPVSSFTEALAGRAAGVQVSSNDGQPGSSQEIVIRGAGSLTQDNSPLYVVDGFPMEDFQASSLNPNDIESLNILKDASATAIYGARAANGVIVIETKKGKLGKPVVDINSSLGYQDIRKQLDLMNPYEFVKYQTELNPTYGNDFYLSDGKTLDDYKAVKGINWQDEVFRTALTQIHNISIRGGTNQTKYSVSGSVFDQNSVIINTGFKRYQGRVSLDQEISEKIKIGLIANYSNSTAFGIPVADGTSNISNYLFYNTWGYRPISGTGKDLLTEEVDEEEIDANQIRVNPVLTAENAHNKNIVKNLSVNFYTTYNITKELTLKVTAATSSRDTRNEVFYNSLTPGGSPRNLANSRGINGRIQFSGINNWANENILTYNKTIKRKHKINVLAGFSMQGTKRDRYGYSAQLLPNEELGIAGFDEGTPLSLIAEESRSTLMSFFNRINYNYKSRYLFTATFRSDGSSKFAAENRWGFFPSGAFAWNMVNEKFMKPLTAISSSKFRISYGLTGNNRVGDFSYLPSLSLPANATVSFNNSTPYSTVIFNGLGNKKLKWETTKQLDIGYDLGLFKDRIQLTADIYSKTTDDLLLNAQLPFTTGFSNAFKNIGKVKNEGLELSLNTVNIKTKSFSWQSNFNISFNRSEVLALTEGQNKLFATALFHSFYANSPLWVAEVGKPVASFHGYIFDGIYQFEDFDSPSPNVYQLKSEIPTNGNSRESIKPGDIKYKDLNNDGIVNSLDQTVIGRAIPLHIGGFSNSFSYKGFLLNVFLQWSYGNKIYNANRLLLDGNALQIRNLNQFASYENRWTPENPSNEYFRSGGQGPSGYHSSRILEDGSYLRLKTISLGYEVPTRLIKRFYLRNLTVQASAQNLLTFTNYSGMDPEVSVRNSTLSPGFDYSAYPNAQTIVFGLKASF